MFSVKEAKHAITGPIASVSTPFERDGSIDFVSLGNLTDFIIEGGSHAVLLTFGDSLYSVLSDTEIAEVTRAVVEQAAGRVPVIAATGRWWTGQCVEFAKYVKSVGADILMSLPPDWAQSCSNNMLIEHYSAISKEMPVMMVTALGTRPLPIPVIEELMDKEKNIVAVKDDLCGNYGRRMASVVDGRIAVLSGGLKENHLDVMPFGADGYLSVYMRFRPEIAWSYWKAVQTGNIPGAVRIIKQFERPFMEGLTQKTGLDFDAVIHTALEAAGIAKRWRRSPYKNADAAQLEVVKAFVESTSL